MSTFRLLILRPMPEKSNVLHRTRKDIYILYIIWTGGSMEQAVSRSPTAAPRRWGLEFASRSFHRIFLGGRIGVWVGFSQGFSRFFFPAIYFIPTFSHSSYSFRFISSYDGTTGVVGRHPCCSQIFNIGASSHLIPRTDLLLDMSWGYLFKRTQVVAIF